MLFSRMVGGLGNQLFQTAAFLKYRSRNEKVIISFLGDIHIPKRENCLNSIFEIPNWIYYDNSKKLSLLIKVFARSSATLRFGSYLPLIGINDRNFHQKESCQVNQKLLFLDGYFNQNWSYKHLNSLFRILKLKPIKLNKEQLKLRDQSVIIHIRGGDFLAIKNLNICKLDYYKNSIEYALSKGLKTFTVICEDQRYGKEVIKGLKKCFNDLQISIVKSNSIKNDFNLIRSSKFAILSNSTFSWWASFLSNSKQEFLVPYNFSSKDKRILLPNETIIN
ncbi:alpha-1,2-fucosyltransferase [Prochlorococcus sp. AH-736-E15]|nr:alpha-1,2-fucosyltransferase [Prochlorococcus sp. AH-736-E15]